MFEKWIGKQSVPVKNDVERGAVKKFAEAIGDPHPLYVDEDYAKNTIYGGLIAPPTFPQTFDYGKIEGLPLPQKGLIHGEQSYTYNRPLKVGEEVWCYTKLENVYEKTGGSGTLMFLVFDRIGEDREGQRIYTARSVAIMTEAVRKELEK